MATSSGAASRPNARGDVRGRRIEHPPSMVQLATEALRHMILGGELLPGDRIIENRLTVELGVSRPPLREALRLLEQQGLVEQVPRRGAFVRNLTLHDVYEIFTLRRELERLAVDLGMPVRDPLALRRCENALAAMQQAAEAGDQAVVTEHAFEFHVSVIGLSGHRRLEDIYRSLNQQMLLCMALNRQARAKQAETLLEDVGRHRRLLELIESGDVAAVHHALEHHGDLTFLDGIEDRLGGHSEVSLAWLLEMRKREAS